MILSTLHLSKSRGHSFGRHAEWCDQVLPKLGSVSRQHAALVHTRQGPVIVDLFSSHGTTLNDKRLAPGQPYALHEGDVARFGGAGSFYKFKGTGRPKRDAAAAAPSPIVPSAAYTYSTVTEDGAPAADASAAGASTAAAAAPSTASGASSASAAAGDKRKRESDGSSRKDARGEHGGRLPGSGSSGSGSGGGLPNPKTDRVRCRHLLVKHSGSRRPSSWRCEHITISPADARAKLSGLRAQLIAGNPSASELESRFIRLATAESDCSSAKHGGDLGFFTFPKMQPAFSTASFQLRVGDLSDIVDTDSGCHIIWRKE